MRDVFELAKGSRYYLSATPRRPRLHLISYMRGRMIDLIRRGVGEMFYYAITGTPEIMLSAFLVPASCTLTRHTEKLLASQGHTGFISCPRVGG
jgi:hypothetical protein